MPYLTIHKDVMNMHPSHTPCLNECENNRAGMVLEPAANLSRTPKTVIVAVIANQRRPESNNGPNSPKSLGAKIIKTAPAEAHDNNAQMPITVVVSRIFINKLLS
jgi:hypothetical protein